VFNYCFFGTRFSYYFLLKTIFNGTKYTALLIFTDLFFVVAAVVVLVSDAVVVASFYCRL